jgi:HNH endonuclease
LVEKPRMSNYRKIYEQHYGPIPKGHHIHHKDMNHSNDDPLNLEALAPDEHAQKHGFLNNFLMAQSTAIERSVAANKSPESRFKKSAAAKRRWGNQQERERLCEAQNERWKNPDERIKMGKAQKDRFNDPKERAKVGDAQRGKPKPSSVRKHTMEQNQAHSAFMKKARQL